VAIFTAQVQTFQRAAGRSVVAAAAYRSGERLRDERLEMTFDFGAKDGITHTEIMAPAGAPAALADRGTLWNAAEKADVRKDSVPAREILLALPHELDAAQRVALVREFAAESLVGRGMIADIAVHEPGQEGDQRNHHAHVMMTTREVGEGGFGKKVAAWNLPELVSDLRREWAEAQNRHLAQHLGKDAPRVTEKSLAERGVRQQAGMHLGPEQMAMKRRGEFPERAAVNAGRTEANADIRERDAKLDRDTAAGPRTVRETLAVVAEMEAMRDGMVRQRDVWRERREAAKAPRAPTVKSIENAMTRPAVVAQKRAARRLEHVEKAAKAGGVKASHIQQWARDPVKMALRTLWTYNRSMDAVLVAQKAHREAGRALAERRAWLKSPEGRERIAALRDPALAAASAVRTERRTLDRSLNRMEARIARTDRVILELKTVRELGDHTLVVPETVATDRRPEANQARYIKSMRAPATERLAKFPPISVAQAMQRVLGGRTRQPDIRHEPDQSR
jgi:hypothetical protein